MPANLILSLAFLTTMVGIAAIGANLYAGAGRDLARLGSAAAIVGGTIALANIGIETFAFRQLAALNIVFLVGSLLVTVWAIAAGVLLARDEPATAPAAAPA